MSKLVYIACSSFSGSTLLSFLLNTHMDMTTAGHMIGWNYQENRKIPCSCGEDIAACAFYRHIAKRFHENGLPFEFWNFGTDYRLVRNDRLNRLLTHRIPLLNSGPLEAVRDALVGRIPAFSKSLARIDRANALFVSAALSYSGASVFVENGHRASRLRNLARIADFDLHVVHLVRDFRGVVHSYVKNRSWDAGAAAGQWLRDQSEITELINAWPKVMTVQYENLCDSPKAVVDGICEFVGLPPRPLPSDFRACEHHILGNTMRLGGSKLLKDIRWQRDMSQANLETAIRLARKYAASKPNHSVSRSLASYLDSTT